MKYIKQNLFTILIVLATVILAVIAVFTAIKLYTGEQKPQAPTAPQSVPEAKVETQNTQCQSLVFTLSTPTATPTATPEATSSPSATPKETSTPSPTPKSTPKETSTPSPSPIPTLTSTPSGTSTPAPTSTPTDTLVSTTPTPTQEAMPAAGIALPTIIGVSAGIILILGALLLAL